MFVQDFWDKDLAIMLPKEEVKKVEKYNGSKAGWAHKENKKQGRPLTNMSSKGPKQEDPVNNPFTREACMDEWGKIKHPSIDLIVTKMVEYYERQLAIDPTVKWEDLRIWKLDFKGAFTLLSFNPEEITKVGVELTGDIIMLFLCGIFGWTGTPPAFQVINRAVMFELEKDGVLAGVLSMFADDLIGFCFVKDLEHDMNTAENLCIGLMGKHAMEPSKRMSGTSVDIIGYHVDLNSRMVGIKERNAKRAIYGFLSVDTEAPLCVKTCQRMASWGSRYGKICPYLLPLVKTLYGEYKSKGKFGHKYTWRMSEECATVVRIFRAMLMCIGADAWNFGRRMDAFRVPKQWTYVVEFDASLFGVGVIIYEVSSDGLETPIGYAGWSLSQLNFGEDSSYQNSAEFIAGILGLLCIIKMKLPRDGLKLRGDSTSALMWTHTYKFRSDKAQAAALYFVHLILKGNMKLVEPEFINGKVNWRSDWISREWDMDELGRKDERLKGIKKIDWDCSEVLNIVKPKQSWAKEEDFLGFWERMNKSVVDMLKG
jgi:hypothetical protein